MTESLSPSRPEPALGAPLGTARLRVDPEDFRVEELTLVAPDGYGEHLLIEICKRDRTTQQAVAALAQACGVAPAAVGYAGLKDRRAVTRQWLSVHQPTHTDLEPGLLDDGLALLSIARHSRKLRIGALRGNRFRLVLRDVGAAADRVSARLAAIARRGVPNYFGPQRFGHGGRNLDRAVALFAGRLRVRDRRRRGLLFSAARSELFNRVLIERVRAGSWDGAIDGDLMMLDGSHSLFSARREPTAGLARRLALMAIHPTGPLPGRAGPRPEGDAAVFEDAVLEVCPELFEGLQRYRIKAMRRPLRLRVADLHWRFPRPETVELGFSLPPGAYATAVVEALFGVDEAMGARAEDDSPTT